MMKDDKVAVLLEDLKSQFRAFAEGQDILSGEVKGLSSKVDRNTEKIDGIAEMVGKNTEDIEIIKSDITFIKAGLNKFTHIEAFETLEKRVALLERKVARVR